MNYREVGMVPKIALAVVMATSFLLAGYSAGEAQTEATPSETVRMVEAVGQAPIAAGDYAQAREKAIQVGLANAVTLVAQEMFTAVAGGERLPPTLAARILDQPAHFIRNYRVVEEAPGDDGETYEALVEAAVALEVIRGALPRDTSAPGPTVTRPTVLLALAEQGVDDFIPRFWWGGDLGGRAMPAARAMARVLGARQFPLVANQTAARDTRFTALYGHPELTDQQALDMAARLGADVIIHGLGQVVPGPASLGTKISTFKGKLAVRALDVGSGRVVAETQETVVTVGTAGGGEEAKALERAGSIVAERLSASLAELTRRSAGARRDFMITVSGTADLAQFVRLRRAMELLPGMGAVRLLEMQRNSALMRVAFEGSGERLQALLQQRLAGEMNLAVEPLGFANLHIALPATRPEGGSLVEDPLGN